MMAKRLGRVATLEVSNDGGTTWMKVGRVIDANLNANRAEVDASDQDDGANSSWLRGRRDLTIDGTLRYDPEDQGQQLLEESYFADDPEPDLKVRWRSKEAVGEPEYIADGFVTTWQQSRPDEAPQDVSFTIRLSGAVSHDDQQATP